MLFLTNYNHDYRLNETEVIFDTSEIQFIPGQRGSKLLSFGGYTFVKNRATEGIKIHHHKKMAINK